MPAYPKLQFFLIIYIVFLFIGHSKAQTPGVIATPSVPFNRQDEDVEIGILNEVIEYNKSHPGTHMGMGYNGPIGQWVYYDINININVPFDGQGRGGNGLYDVPTDYTFCGWRLIEDSTNNAQWSVLKTSDKGLQLNYAVDSRGDIFNRTNSWLKLKIQYRAYSNKSHGPTKPSCNTKYWTTGTKSVIHLEKPPSMSGIFQLQIINEAVQNPCHNDCSSGTITFNSDFIPSGGFIDYRIEDMLCGKITMLSVSHVNFPKISICINASGYGQIRYSKNVPGAASIRSSFLKDGDVISPP